MVFNRGAAATWGAIFNSMGFRELLHIVYLSRKKVECCDVILSLRYKLQFFLIEK